MCRTWMPALAVAVLAGAARTATAQHISGTVRDNVSHNPVAGAILTTLDTSGIVVARATADAHGRFTISRGPAVTRLRAIHIGFAPTSIDFGAAPRDTSLDVALVHLPPMLGTVVATSDPLCPGAEPQGTAYDLWQQARAAFLSASVARRQAFVSATVLSYELHRAATNDEVRSQSQVVSRGTASRPFASMVDPTIIATTGFLTEDARGRTFYGPDDEVLLDDAFPATHCFQMAMADPAHVDQVGLEFTPAPGRDTLVDVRGTIWMDAAPLALRSLEFSYTGLEPAAMRLAPGGRVDFATADNGLVFATSWRLRLPIVFTAVQQPGTYDLVRRRREQRTDVRVTDVEETGAEILDATWNDGTRFNGVTTTIAGLVMSSEDKPVADVAVALRGLRGSTRTDSVGRFTIAGVLPGRYELNAVDSTLGRYAETRRVEAVVDVARGQTAMATMRLPSLDAASAAACGRTSGVTPRANLFGRVDLPRDARRGPVRIEATWDENDGEVIGSRYADIDSSGSFRICRVARASEVILHLSAGTFVADTAIRPAGPTITSLVWRPALKQPVVATAERVVSGVVVDSGKAAVRGAQLVAAGRSLGTSDDRGRFSFRVPARDTVVLDARHIGYMPSRALIMSGADTTVVLTLLPYVQRLDGVDISEHAPASAALLGYQERLASWKHANTMQYFITEADIKKRGTPLVTSMLGDLPGLILRAGKYGEKTRIWGLDRAHPTFYCDPIIYVDGHRVIQDDPLVRDGLDGWIRSGDIAGIEYYPNVTDAPVQYQMLNGWCAVILIWSKGPPGN